ncbi:MAG: hypothetical protein J6Z17_05935 [Treponema sp.]|nr:hypothetical protein [Treponema sp.]
MNLEEEVYKRYGFIKRARGCFLYTQNNKRLVDLYRNGGSAVLGWGSSYGKGSSFSAFTMMKNFLSRGLTGVFKTNLDLQSDKACSALFNSQRFVRFFSSSREALDACRKQGIDEPLFFYPWMQETLKKPIEQERAIVFTVPFAWGTPVYAAAFLEKKDYDAVFSREFFLPPPLRAAANRSIYDLILALQEMQEKDWFFYDKVLTDYFVRKGPWLFSKVSSEDYESFVLHCLELGIIINPEYNGRSIVPFKADRGVLKALEKNKWKKE